MLLSGIIMSCVWAIFIALWVYACTAEYLDIEADADVESIVRVEDFFDEN